MKSAARFYGSQEQRERWTLLVDSVKTGTSVVPALRGKSSFEYFADKPELAELFNQTMTSVSEMTDATVVAGYDFSAYPTIVDVGGGHGPLLAAILAAAPASRGVLYDLPRVVANAPSLLRKQGVADRVAIAEGSFFDSVPGGGDAYLLKNVIHDWPDETALHILRNVRRRPAPSHGVAGRIRDPPAQPRLPRQMGRPGDAAESGRPGTHRGRIPRPARRSRISAHPGGADGVTAQRDGSQSRVENQRNT